MDILAHGLWTNVVAKMANGTPLPCRQAGPLQSRNIKLNSKWSIFWGMFPDLFAFTIPFVWFAIRLITGSMGLGDFPHPDKTEPSPHNTNPIFHLTGQLYSLSHSSIIFATIAIVILFYCYFLHKKYPFEIFGWLLHILIDIPSHSYRFYPTPVFWPISQWKFDGLSWADSRFLVLNYLAIIIVYIALARRDRRKVIGNSRLPLE